MVEAEGQLKELIGIARAMAPRFGARAAQTESARRMPAESIREMVDSGLVKMMVPARYGGHELGYDALFDVTLELGRQCASSAWCFGFLVCHGWMVGLFPDEAQREVWRDGPNALIANQTTPLGKLRRTDDGFVLDGSWPFVSGIDHCDWVGLGAIETAADGSPVGSLCLVHKNDLVVEDTWLTAGLCGSGSNTVHAKNVRLEPHRVILRKDMLEGRCPGALVNAAPVYRLPLLAGFETALAAPILATTQGALELCEERARTRKASDGQLAIQHAQLGQCAVELDAARTLLRRDLAEGMAILGAGNEVSLEHRARVRRDSAFAARLCNNIMDRLMSLSGGSSIYDSNPLQRAWRDVRAMSGHIVLGFDASMEHAGRIAVGLKPNVESY